VPAASLRGMPLSDPSRMRVELLFGRNNRGDCGRVLLMLEALGGLAAIAQFRHVVAVTPAASLGILKKLVQRDILVSYKRGDADYVRFTDHPSIAPLRRLLCKLVEFRYEYYETFRHLRVRAVAMSGLKRLGDDWMEKLFDPSRPSRWFPRGRAIPPFFGPYSRYQLLSLLAERGPLRRNDIARILKIGVNLSNDPLVQDGAVLAWR